MSFANIDVETSSDFIKLKAGEVVTFHILSETPDKKIVHWVNKKKVVCSGAGCQACIDGDKPKQRWTADVWDRKDQKIKKLEFGAAIASQFKSIAEMLAENAQDIHQVDIRIKTSGSALETEYSVLHVPKSGSIPADVTEKYI